MDILFLLVIIFAVFFGLPMMFALPHLIIRMRYPIIAEISYDIGTQQKQGKTIGHLDRLGFRPIRKLKAPDMFGGEKERDVDAKEWRLYKANREVKDFDYGYVEERSVPMFAEWFPLRKRQKFAKIWAKEGPEGELFFAMRIENKGEIAQMKIVMPPDRSVRLSKIYRDIVSRNQSASFWQQNWFKVAMGGLAVVFLVLMFFNTFFQAEASKNWAQAAAASQQCSSNYLEVLNKTSNQTVKPVVPPNIAGIPFGAG